MPSPSESSRRPVTLEQPRQGSACNRRKRPRSGWQDVLEISSVAALRLLVNPGNKSGTRSTGPSSGRRTRHRARARRGTHAQRSRSSLRQAQHERAADTMITFSTTPCSTPRSCWPIGSLAIRSRLPMMGGDSIIAEKRGSRKLWRESPRPCAASAISVDKILKAPARRDLPMERPSKFDLVMNVKTAQALGSQIPLALLQRARAK